MNIFTNRACIILFIVLISMLTGCSNEDSIKDIAEDDLLVEHWYELDEGEKFTIVKNAMAEGKIYVDTRDNDQYMDFQIGLLNQTFLKKSYRDLNLKKAIISFFRDEEIIETGQ